MAINRQQLLIAEAVDGRWHSNPAETTALVALWVRLRKVLPPFDVTVTKQRVLSGRGLAVARSTAAQLRFGTGPSYRILQGLLSQILADPNNTVYNLHMVLDFTSGHAAGTFREAVRLLVRHTATLRTGFVFDGATGYVQVCAPAGDGFWVDGTRRSVNTGPTRPLLCTVQQPVQPMGEGHVWLRLSRTEARVDGPEAGISSRDWSVCGGWGGGSTQVHDPRFWWQLLPAGSGQPTTVMDDSQAIHRCWRLHRLWW